MSAPPGLRVGVDIGGTFTDIVVLAPGAKLARAKVLTTHDAYEEGIATGLASAIDAGQRSEVTAFAHGTTVATNAILEEKPKRIALITTAGFRDVIELRRARRPHLYQLDWNPPKPLVGRALRLEVDERIDGAGQVVTPLDEAGLESCIATLRTSGVEAVAICFLNSFTNPVHESKAAERVAAALPGVMVTYSAMLAPESGEYERTSTTAINAFLLPVVHKYLMTLAKSLKNIGISASPEVMQSDGTMASAALVRERPFLMIESGPAAGVVAAARLAEELDDKAVIAFDMGGTTAKASLIEDFQVVLSSELEVGDSINRGGGHARGAGYVVRSPCVDLTEVGSGGGSIAWIDGGGMLRVGPQSTGSMPGPACYGFGGTQPTVTDAHVVLGYLNPEAIAGGGKRIHRDLAENAVSELALRLNVSTHDAAYGIFMVANATMRRAVRSVSVERGRDPRTYTLYSFGGAGGLHAAALAGELEMARVVIPIAPGLFSSLGLMLSDVAVSRIGTRRGEIAPSHVARLLHDTAGLAAEARGELERLHGSSARATIEAHAALRYVGQSSSLMICVPTDISAESCTEKLTALFHGEHQRVFGQCAEDAPIESVSLRVRATLPAPRVRFDEMAKSYLEDSSADRATNQTREMYFGPRHGFRTTPITRRGRLPQEPTVGPLVVEERESTIVIPPGFSAYLHGSGSIIIAAR